MLNVQDVADDLGIDELDEVTERRLNRLISVAQTWLKGAVHEHFNPDDSRAEELALLVIGDLYDNRTLEQATTTYRRLVTDFTMQLRLEAAKNDAECVGNPSKDK